MIPPSPPTPERFELPPVPTLLGLLWETEDAKALRIAKIRKTAARFYRAVEAHLGADDTTALFDRLRRPAKKGKRPYREQNAELLRTYDARIRAGHNARTLPREIAEARFGKGDDRAKSLARRIRRLVKERVKDAVDARTRHANRHRRRPLRFARRTQ